MSDPVVPGSAGKVRIGCDVYARTAGLTNDLEHLKQCGYDAAEFSIEGLGCVLGGRVVPRMLDRVAAACAQYADTFVYSVHAPAALDLRDRANPDLHRDILLSSITASAALGARVLVVHYESESGDPAIEAQYRRFVEEGAELAGKHELILGIENIEVERCERVHAFLESVRHPWVRMTYDFGHDYLAGDLFGYDHLATARASAQYAAHLHITDNLGKFNQRRLGDFNLWRAIPYGDLIVTGMGDLHLPAGWGTLPFAAAFAPFAERGYSGILVSEHDRTYLGEADREVRDFMVGLTAGR